MTPDQNLDNQAQPGTTVPSKHNGQQGIDKAPAEESSDTFTDPLRETQKGKKVDADPTLPADQPLSI